MPLVFNYKDTQDMLESSIQVSNWRKNINSNIYSDLEVNLTWNQIQSYITQFYYNVGKLSDGTVMRIPGTTIYFKIPSTLNLWSPNRDTVASLQSATQRVNSGRKSLSVWINGIKVPSDSVLLYATSSRNTDIFVPINLINKDVSNTFFFEVNENKTYLMLSGYISNVSLTLSSISIPFNMNSVGNLETLYKTNNGFSPDYNLITMVYLNGILVDPQDRQVVKYSSGLSVTILTAGQFTQTGNIELVLDYSIVYKNKSTNINNKSIFNIEETFQDPSLGSVPLNSCKFYMGGLRIPNYDVSQIGLLHYSTPSSSNLSGLMFVSDKYSFGMNYPLYYGEDFFLYNMVGSDGVTNFLIGSNQNAYLSGKFDINALLNDNGIRWTEETIKSLIDSFENATSYEQKIKLLINAPSGYRNFLKLFKKDVFNYIVDYNGTDSLIYIGGATISGNQSAFYDICVSGNHIPSNLLNVNIRGNTQVVGIPGSYFLKGNNMVSLQYWIDDNRQLNPIIVDLSSINSSQGVYSFVVATPNGVLYNEDIVVLKTNTGDPSKKYVSTLYQAGYIQVQDCVININGSITTITVPVTSVSDVTSVMVYSMKFVQEYSFQIQYTENETVDSLIVPLYFGDPKNPIPLLSNGKIVVYAGSTPLEEGVDYFFRSFMDNDQLTYSAIVMLNKYENLTNIDVYFTGIQNKIIWTLNGTYNDEYGLMYIGELNFPFDKSYMTVKVNHNKLSDADYDVLSDKLIRVFNVPTPFNTITVETEFSEDYDLIFGFAGTWTESPFEIAINSLFLGADYPELQSLNNPTLPNLDSVYQSFVTGVDSYNHQPNNSSSIVDYYNTQRINLYVEAYLEWMLSGVTKATVIIPGNWLSPALMDKFSLYLQNITTNRDIVITASQDLLQDVVTNQRNYPLTYGERIKFLANWFQKYGGSISDGYSNYINTPESDQLYEWDLVPMIDIDPTHRMQDSEDIVLGYQAPTNNISQFHGIVFYQEVNGVPSFVELELDTTIGNSFDISAAYNLNQNKNSHTFSILASVSGQGTKQYIGDLAIINGVYYITPFFPDMSYSSLFSSLVSFDGNNFNSITDNVGGISGTTYHTYNNSRPIIIKEVDENSNILLISYDGTPKNTFNQNNKYQNPGFGGSGYSSTRYAIYNAKLNKFRRKFVGNDVENGNTDTLNINSATMTNSGVIIGIRNLDGNIDSPSAYTITDEDKSFLYYTSDDQTPLGTIIGGILTSGGLYKKTIFDSNTGNVIFDQTSIYNDPPTRTTFADYYNSQPGISYSIINTKDGFTFRLYPCGSNSVNFLEIYTSPLSNNTIPPIAIVTLADITNILGSGFSVDYIMSADYDIIKKQIFITFEYFGNPQFTGYLYGVFLFDINTLTYKVFYNWNNPLRGMIISNSLNKQQCFTDFTKMDIFLRLFFSGIYILDINGRNFGNMLLGSVCPQIDLSNLTSDLSSINNRISMILVNSYTILILLPSEYMNVNIDGTLGSWVSYPNGYKLVDITRTEEGDVYAIIQQPSTSNAQIFILNSETLLFENVYIIDMGETPMSIWSDHGGIFIMSISIINSNVYIYRFDQLSNRIYKNTINSIKECINTNTPSFSLNGAYKLYRSKNEIFIAELFSTCFYRSKDAKNFLSYNFGQTLIGAYPAFTYPVLRLGSGESMIQGGWNMESYVMYQDSSRFVSTDSVGIWRRAIYNSFSDNLFVDVIEDGALDQ